MSAPVGKKVPDFNVTTVLGNGEVVEGFTLSEAIKGKCDLVFFYPLDFTFVCPPKLIALDHRIPEFQTRNVEVIDVSIDFHFTHNAWRNTLVDKDDIDAVKYTLAADAKHEIAKAYDVESDGDMTLRGAFLINRGGVMRSQIVDDLPLGHNMDGLLRLVDTLQFHEECGEIYPTDWKEGDKSMTVSPEGVAKCLVENANKL